MIVRKIRGVYVRALNLECQNWILQLCQKLFVLLSWCCDHCPAPFPYFVRQKGYFHLFPLTVGILSTLNFILSLLFTLFHCFILVEGFTPFAVSTLQLLSIFFWWFLLGNFLWLIFRNYLIFRELKFSELIFRTNL